MGFGGSVQGMITSLKNNARPKTDIFTRSKNDKDVIHSAGKPLKYKEVSKQELEKIKGDIRLRAENERRRIIGTVLFIIIALVLVVFYMIN
ncbi:MAG: hypothetical protein N4A59_03105 [Marinifilum sp.]|jgi:hypothetical protein|nr:hypothetical protein [Marinifilum sp.]